MRRLSESLRDLAGRVKRLEAPVKPGRLAIQQKTGERIDRFRDQRRTISREAAG